MDGMHSSFYVIFPHLFFIDLHVVLFKKLIA